MSILFSILVPVYNVEKYLAECIESVLAQTYSDYELILVDDGSTDSSGEICDTYVAKDSRIIVIHQPNQGHTMARRRGLAQSKGDYCLFLDSDDYWSADLLQTVSDTITEFHCDMVLFRFRCFNETCPSLFESKPVFPHHTLFGKDNRSSLYRELILESFNSLCIKAIKRNIFDNTDYTDFRNIKNGEDLFQTLPLVSNASCIVYLDRVLYNYRITSSSIAQTHSLQKLKDILYVRSVLLEYIKRWGAGTAENITSYHYMTFRYLLDYGFALVNATSYTGKRKLFEELYSLPSYMLAQPYYQAAMYKPQERFLLFLFRKKFARMFFIINKLNYWVNCLKIRISRNK